MSPRREELPGIVQQRRLRQRFLDQLQPGEALLSYGKLRESWDYIAVTAWRLIWREGSRFLSLRFDQITGIEEIIEESHRYALRFTHERIERPRDPALPWDLPRHWRRFRRRHTWNRETVLRFSRRDTEAAKAIRAQIERHLGEDVLAQRPRVIPHKRDAGVVLYERLPDRMFLRRR